MSSRAYLAAFGAVIFALAAALYALVWAVDPFGLSGSPLEHRNLNKVKVARGDQDRHYRFYDPIVRRPEIIFLGTSRVNKSIDPEVIAALTRKPAYNAGVNGASIHELLSLLRSWLERGVPVHEVIVDLYYWRMIPRPDNSIPPHRPRALEDFFALKLSTPAVSSAMRTILVNATGAAPRHFAKDGFERPRLTSHPKSQEGGFANWPLSFRALVKPVDEAHVAPVAEIRDLCRRYAVKCRFIISPIHPYRLAIFEQQGLLFILAEWKRALVQRVEVNDFSRYDASLFHAFCEPTTAWLDPGHFSPETGDRIVRALFGPGTPGTFGGTIDHRKIDAENEEWATQIKAWIARNPDFGRQMADGSRSYECPLLAMR